MVLEREGERQERWPSKGTPRDPNAFGLGLALKATILTYSPMYRVPISTKGARKPAKGDSYLKTIDSQTARPGLTGSDARLPFRGSQSF